jgi:hypothetical protein|tara:strand:+ start:463 stop:936 length:474 start_codon:yes stop_codon:yes gene_type:complete
VEPDILKDLPEDPDLSPTERVRKAILSADMYTFPGLYDRWTEGFESGLIRGTRMRVNMPTPIPQLLTAAHEAHFRCEVYLCLSRRGYSHPTGQEEAGVRKKLWKKMCALVASDRKNNAVAAHTDRLARRHAAGLKDTNKAPADVDSSDDEMDESLFT